VRDERRVARIDEIVVRPDRRRQGVASALLDAALAWARDQAGVTAVDLTVWEFNNEARAFYEAHGFETLVRHLGRPLD
jgi:GNAT superfamily N-acetyltransferase